METNAKCKYEASAWLLGENGKDGWLDYHALQETSRLYRKDLWVAESYVEVWLEKDAPQA